VTRPGGSRGVTFLGPVRSKEVVNLVDTGDEPDRDARTDDPALEEIRRLFARYRRIARHATVSERVEPEAEDDQSSPAADTTGTRAPHQE
jgi:hypothetical protein